MSEMLTVKNASKLWNMEERRITVLCREGRIPGAMKQGKNWLIPANAEKLTDKRVKTAAYRKEKQGGAFRSLLVFQTFVLPPRSIII